MVETSSGGECAPQGQEPTVLCWVMISGLWDLLVNELSSEEFNGKVNGGI